MSKKSSPIALEENFPRCLKFLKNSSKNTIQNYLISIKRYEQFHNMSIEELVCEALDEQAQRVPMHQLKIIDRLEEFQEHLIKEDLVHSTIQNYVSKIKGVYHKNRVNIPYIEPLNPKRTKRNPVMEFKDVLTKEELKKVIPLMSYTVRARAMAMIQGGLSNEECEHLTTRSFIDELYPYHQEEDDVEALLWLADPNHPVIWVTRLTRIKTGKPYYALIGSEAVNMIAEAKLHEMNLPKNHGLIPSKLLDCHKLTMNYACQKINERLKLGQAGGGNKLKPHNLRRFHATYIKGSALTYEEHSLISNREIDELQGRGKTSVQDTYIKSNPLEQKLIYAKVMNNLSLWHEYDYHIQGNDVSVTLRNPYDDMKVLEEKVDVLASQLKKRRKASSELQKLRRELGNDVFDSMISDILNAS